METTTLMILMAATLVILAIVVGVLILHIFNKNDELRQKNDVIVREVRRNQELIERAVQNGVKRSVMLMNTIVVILLISISNLFNLKLVWNNEQTGSMVALGSELTITVPTTTNVYNEIVCCTNKYIKI